MPCFVVCPFLNRNRIGADSWGKQRGGIKERMGGVEGEETVVRMENK